MSFYEHNNKFLSMFDMMGCGPSNRMNRVTPDQDLGVYCQQISVMPLIKRKHSKTQSERRRKPVKTDFTDHGSFIMDKHNREKELISAYDNNRLIKDNNYNNKSKKVFLSQSQSASLTYMGEKIPCAPPVTPTPEVLRHVEYVPSLQDIHAQRTLRDRLQDIEKAKKKQKEKLKEQLLKQEAERKKEELNQLKVYQRSQIYALNAAMTELENQRFKMFQQRMDKS